MEPSIGVDAECLASEVTEVCRLVYALEQREQTYVRSDPKTQHG